MRLADHSHSADSPTKRSKQRSAKVKEIWRAVTDPAQQAAIKRVKYRQYFEMRGDVMWVLMGVRDGKNLCQK